MKNSLTIFFIKGIQVRLHWTFLIFIAWVLLMQALARAPLHIAILTISELLAVFVCVLLHELGHAFAARYYKIPIREIRLLPIGGLTYFTKQPANPKQEIVVSIAGPLVNIIIALAMIPFIPAGANLWHPNNIIIIHTGNFFHFLYNINVILTVINLLPILPLDGGKITKGLLGLVFKPYTAFRIILSISTVCSLSLTIAGLLTGNLLFLIYGGFLLITLTIEKNNHTISFLLKDEMVSDAVSQDYKTMDLHATREEVLKMICAENDRYYILTDNTAIIGILDKETILSTLLAGKKEMDLKEIIIPELPYINADSKIMDVWNALPAKADIIVPVISSTKKLMGVISRDNIIGLLLNQILPKYKKTVALAMCIPVLLVLCSFQQKGGSDTTGYYRHAMKILHDTPSLSWKFNPVPPLPGAILPYKRIVAFYGNLYSPQMGILGELPPEKMKAQLLAEARKWEAADPLFPVQPALHYIAITAQRNPGKDQKYRLRMPEQQIDSVISMAHQIHAIIFLDVQVGHSTLQEELVSLERYLRLPDVHLGIDPEYSMKDGAIPCAEIGTFDAKDINYASSFLQDLVLRYQLPPKILVVHRFTQAMITRYKDIHTCDEVQIVINMDGFGFPAKKKDSYKYFVAKLSP